MEVSSNDNDYHRLIITDKTFDAAQYLPVQFGKCHNLHGHTYHIKHLNIGTKGIVDFSKIKAVIDSFDHCLLTTVEDEKKIQRIADFMTKEGIDIFILKTLAIPYESVTIEYLGQYLKNQLMAIPGVEDVQFEIYETPTNGAIIYI